MTADNFGLWPQSGDDAGRFIVHADDKLTAFLELEAAKGWAEAANRVVYNC